MKIMGMAASQARFLGLTARKSNVEYQGQQINQQRTSLANESAGLYNQMLNLDVPTPPSTSDYYTTTYVLDGSGNGYENSDYTIANLSKTYQNHNEYKITLNRKVEKLASKVNAYTYQGVTEKTEGNKTTKTISFAENYSAVSTKLNYVTQNGVLETPYNEKGNIEDINTNQLYKIDFSKAMPMGFDVCENEFYTKDENGDVVMGPDGKPAINQDIYFFQDKNGQNHFLTGADVERMLNNQPGESDDDFGFFTTYSYQQDLTTEVKGTLEKSDNNRYTSITINDDPDLPINLKGRTFSLTPLRQMDQEAYDQAMNDYEYEKTIYEKTVSDINNETEIVQKQDQQLELRLQQLNTEQDAISQEMDAVTKVINDNVEKTFKVFA